MNPLHLCGECSGCGPICCDTVNDTANFSGVCELRLVFSVQPYGAPALDVEFPLQPPIGSDNIVMIDQGPNTFSMSRSSNPFTLQLTTWTVSCSCVIEGSTLELPEKSPLCEQFTETTDLNC